MCCDASHSFRTAFGSGGGGAGGRGSGRGGSAVGSGTGGGGGALSRDALAAAHERLTELWADRLEPPAIDAAVVRAL